MYINTKMTQKGQITLPKVVRDRLKIRPRSKIVIEFNEKKNEVRIRPVMDFLDLAGTLKPRKNKNVDVLKAREYMSSHYERA